MKNIKYIVLILTSLFINSCSQDSDEQNCPQNEIISMKINGEEMQFVVSGWGIDLDSDGKGHTLQIDLTSGVFYPQQNSYAISLKLPYKKTGNNIVKEITYLRIENTNEAEGSFTKEKLQTKVTVNKNSCFRATFSGSTIINGNQIVITDGILDLVYDNPFEN